MALEGTLRDFSLADIFQLIGLQRKTGVLTLRGKDDTVTVTFLDGKVVGADSLNRRLENRLGTVLIKTGTLSQDQLNRALERNETPCDVTLVEPYPDARLFGALPSGWELLERPEVPVATVKGDARCIADRVVVA